MKRLSSDVEPHSSLFIVSQPVHATAQNSPNVLMGSALLRMQTALEFAITGPGCSGSISLEILHVSMVKACLVPSSLEMSRSRYRQCSLFGFGVPPVDGRPVFTAGCVNHCLHLRLRGAGMSEVSVRFMA